MSQLDSPDLGALIQAYNEQCQQSGDGYYLGDRRADRATLAKALTPERLACESEGELRHLANDLRRLGSFAYGSPGRQPYFYRYLKESAGTAQVADMLRYLLYGDGGQEHVVDRLHECVSPHGTNKLRGISEGITVKALAVTHPERWLPCYITFGTIDEQTGEKKDKETVLLILGACTPAGFTLAETAVMTNDLIRSKLRAAGLPDELWRMQDFAWWLIKNHQPQDTP